MIWYSFLIRFIIDSTMNLISKINYKYEMRNQNAIIFQEHLIIFHIKSI